MKKISTIILFLIGTVAGISAQEVTVPEPEFINSYCMLTSDSTMAQLPKENGMISEHETKTKSLLNKISKVANVAGATGGLGAVIGANSGSVSGVATGVKVLATANSVGNVASSASALAGASGMDVVFPGKSSRYVHKYDGKDVRLLIKANSNEEDPLGIYRIVKFHTLKKQRRIQWFEFKSAVLASEEGQKSGFLNFTGQKYGKQSYLLKIPASEIEKGEYGIFFMSIITATSIPVGTFCIQ